ncbi:hypothetical protein EG328_006437 [Venturia inaequalis]|uniref:Microsomal glutathione S-transferase 3 n=1 Tax=Venturia inaequalis TaxID=5025 RepID=A0A8H3VBY8_VENIN|nr:hypothetical protein EG328_006437 [Venturia inaequalis]RDI81564.1 Versiconal hemiacetal acetate reductase [Venturia inaequalis]
MSISITLPAEYGYVLATATGSFILSTWHGMRVGPFRKAAKIPYPTQYASDSLLASTTDSTQKQNLYLFNCAQRAHYNFLENYVTFLPALLIAGLKYPVASSVLGAAWCVFRAMYATGYTRADKKDGKGRLMGSAFWLAQFALYGMVGKVAWGMVF